MSRIRPLLGVLLVSWITFCVCAGRAAASPEKPPAKPFLGPLAESLPETRAACYLLSVAFEWDFSLGAQGFATTACDHGGDPVWAWGQYGSIPGAPPNAWGTVPEGSYPHDAGQALYSPDFMVTADAHLVEVVHFFSMEAGYDGGHVVVMPGGYVIEPVGGYTVPVISESTSFYAYCVDGQPGWTGSSGGWRIDCFDVSEWVGQTISLHFEFGSDASVNGLGWYLARVRVGRSGDPSAACCFASGECGLHTRDVCLELGGFWNPAWTTCDPNPCSQPCPLPILAIDWDFGAATHGFYGYACDENAFPVWEYGPTSYVPGVAGPVWGTVLQGAYYNESGGGLASPSFFVTDSTKVVEILHYFNFEYGYDGANVSVSAGSPQIIHPTAGYTVPAISASTSYYAYCVDGEPGWTGSSGGWRVDCFDLSAYLGQAVTLLFEMGSDASVTAAGWYIAAIRIGGSTSGYVPILQVAGWFNAESWYQYVWPTAEEPDHLRIPLQLQIPDPPSPITSVDFFFDDSGTWTHLGTDSDGADPWFDSIGMSPPTGDGWALVADLPTGVFGPLAHFRAVAHTAGREEIATEFIIPVDLAAPARSTTTLEDWSIIDEDTLGITLDPNGASIDSVFVWLRMMPDIFDKPVPGINQQTHSQTHCAPTAAAQCLKYFEAAQGDDEVTGHLNDDALVDSLAAYMATNQGIQPGTFLRNWIGGLGRWIEDHGAAYSLRSFRHFDETGRVWTEADWRRIRNEFERCHDVLLGIFWEGTPVCHGGHTLTLRGLHNTALESGNYYATFMDPWTGLMSGGEIDPVNGMIENYNGTAAACIGATLIVTPHEARPGGYPVAEAAYRGLNPWPDPIRVPLPDVGRYFTDVVVTNLAGHAYRTTTPIIHRDDSGTPEDDPRASAFALGLPRPNPFGAGTRIEFTTPVETQVSIAIFDVRGARVRTLIDVILPAGAHQAAWDGRDARGRPAPGGIYYLRMTAPGVERTRSVILLR